jgi:hypothetical protein
MFDERQLIVEKVRRAQEDRRVTGCSERMRDGEHHEFFDHAR